MEPLDRYAEEESDRAIAGASLISAAFAAVFAVALGALSIYGRLTGGYDGMAGPAIFSLSGAFYSVFLAQAARRHQVRGTRAWFLLGGLISMPSFFFFVMALLPGHHAAGFVTGPITYLYAFLIVIAGFRFDPALSTMLGLFAGAQYFVILMLTRDTFLALSVGNPDLRNELTMPVVYAFKAALLAGVGIATGALGMIARRLLARVAAEAEEKRLLNQAFGEYVSPEVRQAILVYQREHKSARKDIAVLFSDLRGFSTFSESRDPAEVVAAMNGYFERMVRAIASEHGIVDKFIGDAVMATFGGLLTIADPAACAYRAARAMRRELAQLNAERAGRGEPPFDNGIGLHFGPVLIGPIGGAGRSEFAVIGDTVNVAARLESLTKERARAILVSDAIYQKLDSTTQTELSALGEVTVKGRRGAFPIYGAS